MKISGFTQENYRVQVILGLVIVQNQIARNETATGITLGTREGVKRYLKECQPLVKVEVTDLHTGKDITNEFVEGLKFVPSRYGQPIQAYDIRRI